MKTILDAMQDPALFSPWFSPWSNWTKWETVLRAIHGLPIAPKDRPFFRKVFGNRRIPTTPAGEVLVIAPRGSGKTLIQATEAVYTCGLLDWSHLKRKIRGLVIANDKEQAQEMMDFVFQFVTESPALAALVASRTRSSVTFKSGVRLSVRAASDRSIRGPSVCFGGCDELPSWIPDRATKILRAFRPALGKVLGSLLLHIGTTGERSGPAFDMHEKFFGMDDAPILIAHAELTDLNVLPEYKRLIAKAYAMDDYSARAEYGSLWMDGESSFIQRDRVTIAPESNPSPPRTGRLFTGVDPNGGAAKGDAFTMATAWVADGRIKVGMLESRAGRRDPTQVVEEFCSILKPLGDRVTLCSDRYAAAWVPTAFRKHGFQLNGPHKQPRASGGGRMSASSYYLSMLGRLRQTDFPNHPAMLAELWGLVRTPEGVDHPASKHDDLINSCARAIHMAGLWLDQQAPDLPEPQPTTEREHWIGGVVDTDWNQRQRGSLMRGERDPDAPEPDFDLLSERRRRGMGRHEYSHPGDLRATL